MYFNHVQKFEADFNLLTAAFSRQAAFVPATFTLATLTNARVCHEFN
jgi:hypothetical protein